MEVAATTTTKKITRMVEQVIEEPRVELAMAPEVAETVLLALRVLVVGPHGKRSQHIKQVSEALESAGVNPHRETHLSVFMRTVETFRTREHWRRDRLRGVTPNLEDFRMMLRETM